MAFRSRPAWPLLLPPLLLALILLTPMVASADGDALSWGRRFSGPPNIPATESSDEVPVAAAMNGVSFADASNGWAIGVKLTGVTPQGGGTRDSLVATTTNGGEDWTPSTIPGVTSQLNAVSARAVDDVWVVGDSGVMVHWDGSTWTRKTVTGWVATKAFRSIAFSSDEKGWAVGDGGGIAVTSNGGRDWNTIVAPGTGASLRGVTAVDDDHAIAVGDGGLVRYVDSTTAYPRSAGTANLFSVDFTDSSHGWAVGNDATFFSTTDGGVTWTAAAGIPLPEGFVRNVDLDLRSVSFSDPANGIVVGTYMSVWRTTDGGRSWRASRVFIDDGTNVRDVELRGVTFAGASADRPVTAGRAFNLQLLSDTNKARVYVGAWSDRGSPDVTPPTTYSDAQASYVASAVITLTAQDDFGGSGVAHTYYVLDGGPRTEGTTISLMAPGTHTLEYWSVDAGDLEEQPHNMRSFTIASLSAPDAVPPVTTAQRTESPGSVIVSLTATDGVDGSGVAQTYYQLDGGAVTTGTAPVTSITVAGAGTHTLSFWSVDAAGLREETRTSTFVVPRPPDTTSPQVTTDAKTLYSMSAAISIMGFDDAEGTGVESISYRRDSESTRTVTFSPAAPSGSYKVSFAVDGAHTLRYSVADGSGNRTSGSVTFRIAPKVTGPYTSVSTFRRNRAFTVYGYVYPYHSSGTYLADLRIYRAKGSGYVYYKTVRARRYGSTSTRSKYSASVSLPYAGKWRIHAVHDDARHTPVSSAYRFLTVR